MSDKMTRVLVPIPPEIRQEVDLLKQSKFLNKSDSEIYRELINLGLEKNNNRIIIDTTNGD